MNDLREKLPSDICEKQRMAARAHNHRVRLLIVGFFAVAFATQEIIRARALSLGIAVLIADVLFVIYALLVLIPRADFKDCLKIEFVCPGCRKPLYYQSSAFGPKSSLITRGACPHCGYSFVTLSSV
jgi:hypothetical protein